MGNTKKAICTVEGRKLKTTISQEAFEKFKKWLSADTVHK
jgi:hypothetical protein